MQTESIRPGLTRPWTTLDNAPDAGALVAGQAIRCARGLAEGVRMTGTPKEPTTGSEPASAGRLSSTHIPVQPFLSCRVFSDYVYATRTSRMGNHITLL